MSTSTLKTEKPRTGLFFGSFNPIHTGHLIIANHLLNNTHLNNIWFVISPLNPLKNQKDLFDEHARTELARIAVEDNPAFSICLRELKMQRPNYSHKTIEILKKENPGIDFTLIIGSDNLEVFSKWKNHDKILEMIPLMVYPRQAECHSPFLSHPGVSLVKAPLIEISSTFIRRCIRENKDIRYLVPDKVYQKIKEGILL